jgi:hypothetical protein
MVWLAALLIAAGPACTDDETGGGNGDTNVQEQPDAEVPANSRLIHQNQECSEADPICAVDVTFTSQKTLAVLLVDGEGAPIPNARLTFELDAGEATGTTLSAANTQTDEAGLAEVDVRAGQAAGVASVTVAVPSEETVEPIRFVVGVSSKDAASYRVSFNHNGGALLRDIEVKLHPSNVTCEDVVEDRAREFDPALSPTLTADFVSGDIADVDGTLPIVTFPNLPNGQAYTVEARAYSRQNGDVEAAFGCTDGNPPIENGISVDVLVDLVDNLPRVAGAYDVTHTISIRDAVCMPDGSGGYTGVLPSGVCLAIDLIGRLATDPASFLLGEGNGDTGLIGLIVDFLPDSGLLGDLKDAITSFLDNQLINGIGRDALNQFFQDWIDNNAPPWAQNAVTITGDIYDTLQNLRVEGISRINEEPVPMYDAASGSVVGLLQADADGNRPGEQVWSDVIIQWSLPCGPNAPASCAERRFGADQIGTADGNIVQGSFTGSLVPLDGGGYGLAIDEHTLTLNFGVLVLGIVEKVVLPSIFGQNVQSFEDAFDSLLTTIVGGQDGCQGLADYVENEVGGGNTVNNIVDNLCTQLLQSASDGIQDFLVDNLTISGEDNFLMSTPTDVPCTLYEPEMYAGEWIGKPFPYAERMGTPEMQCEWDVKIGIGENTTINADATFYGTRD